MTGDWMRLDPMVAFRAVLEDAGLRPKIVLADGGLHRCGTVGLEQGAGGSYYLHLDPPVSGWWKNYRTGKSDTWTGDKSEASGGEGFSRFLARLKADREIRQEEDTNRQAEARERALRVLESAADAPRDHPYLFLKSVPPLGGIRAACDGRLVIPIYDATGLVLSVQFITGSGKERFLFGGQVQGGFFPIRGGDGPVYIVVDYATGATVHAATGETVLVALTSGNLLDVAQQARALYPDRRIVLCADNDHETAVGRWKKPGLARAREAASSIGGILAAPMFQDPAGKSSFNDLARVEGLEVVGVQLAKVLAPPALDSGPGSVGGKKSLVAFNAGEFLRHEFPRREYILDPILTTQGLALLYAAPGRGKTFLALTIAYAVATGQLVLRWKAPKPRQVLFVDGEMQGWMLQERFAGIIKGYGSGLLIPDSLRIVTPDTQADFMPNLATPEGQAALEPLLAGVELLIIDNLATLCRVGKENETESWLPVQAWILSLRRRGISLILVHHANKGGAQRGTSAREDVMDTIISLRTPKGHRTEDGACFEVHLEKARGLAGGVVEPFEAALSSDGKRFIWSTTDLGDDEAELVASLHASGLSIRAIEQKTGLSRSRVHRLLEKQPKSPASLPRKSTGRGVPVSQS